MAAHAHAHAAGGSDPVVVADNSTSILSSITSGETTVPRLVGGAALTSWSSGSLRLSYFTAIKSETVNNISATNAGTAAGATPTLCRMGMYSVDGTGNLTLVAACANDTTLFSSASANYVRALTSPYAKVAGQRYALGVLVVSAATMPTFFGVSIALATSRTAPALSGSVAAQSDLPSSLAVGSISTSGVMPALAVTP